MSKSSDADIGRRFHWRPSPSLARAVGVALALLIAGGTAAAAQPRDGVWEGRDDLQRRVRFLVRGNGTEVALGQLNGIRFVCPTGERVGTFSIGFAGAVRGDGFVSLHRMLTPRQPEAPWSDGFVVRGSFTDSLHAEGKVNGVLAAFTGNGTRTQRCTSHAQTWEASWVGEEPPSPPAAYSPPSEDPAAGLVHDDLLAPWSGDAVGAAARPLDGTWEGRDSFGSRIAFRVRGNGTTLEMDYFGFINAACPSGHRVSVLIAFGGGFGTDIGEGAITFLHRMTTPTRMEVGQSHGFVVRGTFRDSLHGEGTIGGAIASFSGQGLKTQTCSASPRRWKAVWVGPETSTTSASTSPPPGPAVETFVDAELASIPGRAAFESTFYREGPGGVSGYATVVRLEPDEDNESQAAVEPPPPN